MDCLLVVEDAPSEAVLRRLVISAGHNLHVTSVFRAGGFGQIKSRLENFRNASHVIPHIVMTDLDAYPCPPELLKDWKVGKLPDRMLMRIAVREVESWLLADREGIAKLLRVPLVKIPANPDELPDPKQVLLNLARKSKSPRFASEFVPANGSKAKHGPVYNEHLIGFATQHWDSSQAELASPSLERTIKRIKEFAQRLA
jgi:hypothetical protein